MKKPERILVVSMCTRHCLSAVQWGVSLARNFGAKLFVVHIIHNPFGLEGWTLPIPSVQTIEAEYLKLLLKDKATLHQYIEQENTEGLYISEGIINGLPLDEINKFITENQIDLLLMTAHEQERLEAMISGNEIRELTRKMPCSLFLIRRELE